MTKVIIPLKIKTIAGGGSYMFLGKWALPELRSITNNLLKDIGR